MKGVAATLIGLTACTHWVDVPAADVASGKTEIRTRAARVDVPEGRVSLLRVDRVRAPLLEGWDASAGKEVQLDLGRVRSLRVELPDYKLDAAAGYLGVIGAVFLIGTLAVFAICADSCG